MKWRIYLGIGLSVWEAAKYLGNDVDLSEMAQICVEMTLLYDKLLKNVKNDFEIWEMAKIFGKWLRYIGHGISIWESA